MTLITGHVTDVGLNGASGALYATAVRHRGEGESVVAPIPASFAIIDGVVSADVVPGPTRLTIHVGPSRKDWFVNVPETDVGLGDLIDEYAEDAPVAKSVVLQARDDALAARDDALAALGLAEDARDGAELARAAAEAVQVAGVESIELSPNGDGLFFLLTNGVYKFVALPNLGGGGGGGDGGGSVPTEPGATPSRYWNVAPIFTGIDAGLSVAESPGGQAFLDAYGLTGKINVNTAGGSITTGYSARPLHPDHPNIKWALKRLLTELSKYPPSALYASPLKQITLTGVIYRNDTPSKEYAGVAPTGKYFQAVTGSKIASGNFFDDGFDGMTNTVHHEIQHVLRHTPSGYFDGIEDEWVSFNSEPYIGDGWYNRDYNVRPPGHMRMYGLHSYVEDQADIFSILMTTDLQDYFGPLMESDPGLAGKVALIKEWWATFSPETAKPDYFEALHRPGAQIFTDPKPVSAFDTWEPPSTATSTLLVASSSTVTDGSPVTLTATVSPAGAVGTVTFLVDGVSFDVPVVDGKAVTTVVIDGGPGQYMCTADFVPAPGVDFLASSGAVMITVPVPLPVVQIVDGAGLPYEQLRAALADYGLTHTAVTELPFALDTSQATTLRHLFSNCSALTSVPEMDTSNVTDMYGMFHTCSALTSVPQMDTSNVTTMESMYSDCRALTSVPTMDTSNVTTMKDMFRGCWKLPSGPQMDTTNVTTMADMFSTCYQLEFVPDLATANTSTVARMFSNCSKLKDGYVRLIGKKAGVSTSSTIVNSGLTRVPFFDTEGNPI